MRWGGLRLAIGLGGASLSLSLSLSLSSLLFVFVFFSLLVLFLFLSVFLSRLCSFSCLDSLACHLPSQYSLAESPESLMWLGNYIYLWPSCHT